MLAHEDFYGYDPSIRLDSQGCIENRHMGTAWRPNEKERTIRSEEDVSGAPLQKELRENTNSVTYPQTASMAPGLPRTPPRVSPRESFRGPLAESGSNSTSGSHDDAPTYLGSQEGRLAAETAPVRRAQQGNHTEISLHAKLAEPRIGLLLPQIPLTLGSTINYGVGGASAHAAFAEPDTT